MSVFSGFAKWKNNTNQVNLVLEEFCLLRQKFLEMFISRKSGEKVSEPVVCPECEQVCRPWCIKGSGVLRRFVALSV